MKHLFLTILLASTIWLPVKADDYVDGYLSDDGTYVNGYYRTEADSSLYNNYSTRGNVNPYTGQAGTVNPYIIRNNYTVQPLTTTPIRPIVGGYRR